MIITKEGFTRLEEGEYQISKTAIMHTLVYYWTLAKRYTDRDFREAGLPWRFDIEQENDTNAPRDFFNYVYLSEIVRTRIHDWYSRAEGTVEDWDKDGRLDEWRVYRMYAALERHGWSPEPEKAKHGSLGKAAKELRWSRQKLNNLRAKFPEPPEPPFRQQFARWILDYYIEQKQRFGNLWVWNAEHLLPPEYGNSSLPWVMLEDFEKHNRGKKKLDFGILDDAYKEFSRLKMLYYGSRILYITKKAK